MDCPNTQSILAGLKDFQRSTVDYVFQRLYVDNPLTRRFLIADEVGLGKTLVARGVLARAVEHLWPKGHRIDIVYICSNGDIARQNINRLNITQRRDFVLPPRLLMLAARERTKANDSGSIFHPRLNFISFTPGTALDMRSQSGIVDERALLLCILREGWSLKGTAPYNVLQGYVADARRFREHVDWFQQFYTIDDKLAHDFVKGVSAKLKDDFLQVCDEFPRERKVSTEERKRLNDVTGRLRQTLAKTCLKALEPDIVILDEFQRFKHLLDDQTEEAALAQELFSYSDEHDAVRVILLSATPYKMFRMNQEPENDDHYQDFVRTLEFLFHSKEATERVKKTLQSFRSALFKLDPNNLQVLLQLKDSLQAELRQVLVRTERLASTVDRNGMLQEVRPASVRLAAEDLEAYMKLSQLAKALEHGEVLEYWKSSAYPLNFMEDYDLKKRLEDSIRQNSRHKAIREALRNGEAMLLPWGKIGKYQSVPARNARLRSMMSETVDQNLWKLLWVPPSLPYYRSDGAYSEYQDKGITKQLIFSTWKMVPKIVSCLLSFEAERQMIVGFEPNARNTPKARIARKPLLKFAWSSGRLTGLPILTLIYPAFRLAKALDPLPAFRSNPASLRSIAEIEAEQTAVLKNLLEPFCAGAPTTGREDESWYWMAPMLLDRSIDQKLFDSWIEQQLQADPDADDDDHTVWKDHVSEARERVEAFFSGKLVLGRLPEDLFSVLVRVGLGAPGTAALRAVSRATKDTETLDPAILGAAGDIGRAFLSQFNLPESMALLRAQGDKEPYWKQALLYCVHGNLQSTLDEYVHVLAESLGLIGERTPSDVAFLSREMCQVIRLRTASPMVDSIFLSGESEVVRVKPRAMRGRFALRFDNDSTEDGARQVRRDHVRSAFNSPFWPFVLATTSVGQEGLDFHWYCHSVVHWNLPSNPVDLEQREGRVHRYKGHAIRKNLVRTCGTDGNALQAQDVWAGLFETARQKRDKQQNDLVPFWLYPVEGGARIERRILDLPLSKDAEKLISLRKSLAVYRLVFGQSRQEDLVQFLSKMIPVEQITSVCQLLQLDLSPPNNSAVQLTTEPRTQCPSSTSRQSELQPMASL